MIVKARVNIPSVPPQSLLNLSLLNPQRFILTHVVLEPPGCGFLPPVLRYPCSMSRYDRPSHRVYMIFFLRKRWQLQFRESDLKTPLPLRLTFQDPEKIRELARRGEALGTSEAKQVLEHAIERGRGGMYLHLTPDQYRKLR
jgi:hypothetical protein